MMCSRKLGLIALMFVSASVHDYEALCVILRVISHATVF